MHTDTKDVFIALFMAFLYGFTFHENTYDYHERDLRLCNSNSQIGKIVWRLTLPNVKTRPTQPDRLQQYKLEH